MENKTQIEVRSAEDKKKDIRAVKVIGAFAAATAAVVGSYIAFGSKSEQSPKPNTVAEAPATTTTLDSTPPEPSLELDTGKSGGVIVTPENPEVTVPASNTVPEATVEGEGPTSVIVTPENPVETETPVN